MVIKDEIARISSLLKENGIENSMFEANLIIRHFLKYSPLDIILNGTKEIEKNDLSDIENALMRRLLHEPLQYILKSAEFMGLEFYVDENVLIPRPDTETLVEAVLEEYKDKGFSAIDIGTGSGCIAISLAYYNKKAKIHGIDISEGAIEIAKKNALSNGVSERLSFGREDVFSYEVKKKYDIIVSNPPYIKNEVIKKLDTDVKDYEPFSALSGGDDGLKFYKHIIKIAPDLLKSSGMLAVEIGYDQAKEVSQMMDKDFKDIKVIKDLGRNDRVVLGKIKKVCS